jgi:hypothetical protein
MAGEEERGFVIRDRRSRAEESAPAGERAAPSTSARPATETSTPPPHTAPETEFHPPVTFSSFVFSLGTSALMLMGEQLAPQQERAPVNLPQAKEIIDILSVLEGKTKGNLTADEQSVLTDMLYALRMKYVSLATPSGKPGGK